MTYRSVAFRIRIRIRKNLASPSPSVWGAARRRQTRLVLAFLFGIPIAVACSSEPPGSDGVGEGEGDGDDEGDDDDDDDDARDLCDGTDALRLAVYNVTSGNAEEALVQLTKIGWFFLYVDGECNYWTKTADHFAETHTGVLTETQVDDLVEAFSYGSWDDVVGVWENGNAADADYRVIHDGKTGFACYARCPEAPAVVRVAGERAYEVVKDLYEQGEAERVPMRIAIGVKIAVGSGDAGLADLAFDWPLAVGPEVVAPRLFGGEVLEGGFVVTDEQELERLREARVDKQGHATPSCRTSSSDHGRTTGSRPTCEMSCPWSRRTDGYLSLPPFGGHRTTRDTAQGGNHYRRATQTDLAPSTETARSRAYAGRIESDRYSFRSERSIPFPQPTNTPSWVQKEFLI